VKLTKLHEEYIDASKRPMQFGRLPINPKEVELPVVPMDRWILKDKKILVKTYRFRRPIDRNTMLKTLLAYEENVQHHAIMSLREDSLTIELMTKDVEKVTEIDKEYAKFADQVFKDVVMSPDGVRSSTRM
jgi:pterin-4a-carbinolamine dehydratase